MREEFMKTKPQERNREQDVEWIIKQFSEAGMDFEKKKKNPEDGEYAGIVGKNNKQLQVNM